VRRAIEGIRHEQASDFDLAVTGPLVLNFTAPGDEFNVVVDNGASDKVTLASNMRGDIAQELASRGFSPANVTDRINGEVSKRAANIRAFTHWLEHGDI
jgi:hypothetical protein